MDLNRSRERRIIIICVLVALLAAGILVWRDQLAQKVFKSDENISADEDAGIYMINYNGVDYEYNNNIMSVMLIGIDSKGKIKSEDSYDNHARADNIDILILDRRTNRVSILPISRDTITPVHKFSMNGYDMGVEDTHIGFAYSFGDGGRASCLNTQQAVADLLYGISPRYYFTTNLDSITLLNDVLGGVTVTVPNNDVAGRHPELTKGSKVKLDYTNAADFLRYRDTDADYSNNGRMERQMAFMESAIKKIATMSSEEYEELWKTITSPDSNILTNMSNGQFVKIIEKIRKYSIDPKTDILSIKGTNGDLDGYDAFYPDEEALKKLVVDTFFVKNGEL